MSKVTIIVGLILVFCLSVEAGPPAQPKKERYVVYIGGNSWPLGTGSGKVTDAGWVYDAKSVPVSTYFYPGVATGPVTIYLNFSNNLPITIEITILDQNIKWSPVPASSKIRQMRLGLFNLVNNEYSDIVVATSPVVKSDQISGIIESIIIEGVLSDPVYVKPEGSFYWSRRSYSSHLWFNIPTKEPLNAFYTELTLPTGWDTQGAYFMTNGWSVGYSGFQTADRVLISVWSPYDTNDPKSIPADCTVQIMQLGVGIKPNVFGGQGSGQSASLYFPLKTNTTYALLITSQKITEKNSTDYCAYVNVPQKGGWHLIACFRRPKTLTPLSGLYSFLEGINMDNGNRPRIGVYSNQWVRTESGKWVQLLSARISGQTNGRRDMEGGVVDGGFFLKRAGFFKQYTPPTTFVRASTNRPPNFDRSQVINLPPPPVA